MGSRATPMNTATSAQDAPRLSNLTNALHSTTGNELRPAGAMNIGGGSSSKAMSGVFGRRESNTAAQPISMTSSGRERPRRESLAGSMLTGMSWGGTSVGSWIRDDIIMQGTSPFGAYQSPSFHSSSYLPKLEANFMRDFNCCGLTLQSMHDLLQHYEEKHANAMPPLSKQNSNQGRGTPPDPKAAIATGAASAIKDPSKAQQNQTRVNQQSGANTPQRSATPTQQGNGAPIQHGMPAYAQQPQHTPKYDDDTVGDMELDEGPIDPADLGAAYNGQMYPMPQGWPSFGLPANNRVPPLDLNTNQFQQYRGLRESTPTTPVSASRNGTFFHSNPTVSSVNTPTLTVHPTHHPLHQQQYNFTPESSAPGTPHNGELDGEFVGSLSAMNVGNSTLAMNHPFNHFGFGPDNGMMDLQCIDEPAKRLFSLNGGFNVPGASQQQQLQQQQQQPGQGQGPTSSSNKLGDAQYSENSELAKTIREEQRKAGVPDPSADGVAKPFHCPVIGCEKAYKNQNGLKYHKSHGHNTQELVSNENGTYSILDPETHAAYPGTLGMEKHKPYRCGTCGKRYKNLNGLKYHKLHSAPCLGGEDDVKDTTPPQKLAS